MKSVTAEEGCAACEAMFETATAQKNSLPKHKDYFGIGGGNIIVGMAADGRYFVINSDWLYPRRVYLTVAEARIIHKTCCRGSSPWKSIQEQCKAWRAKRRPAGKGGRA